MQKLSENVLGLGISIALGLVLSSGIVSYTISRISSNKQSVVVKGLAEKPVSADRARWEIVVHGSGKTLPEAFAALRANRPVVQAFFREQGFADEQMETGRETFEPQYRIDKEGRPTRDVTEYLASQNLLLASNDVKRVETAVGQIVSLQEKGLSLEVMNPEYLVSTLEAVKMSLIGDATRNAHDRASEFAKTGEAKVGSMKSANQGAFYILPAQGGSNDSEYGGTYDKSTIDKVARVVVTVEYGLTQ
jgi:hypothetical protein